jgi:hypothetical protein
MNLKKRLAISGFIKDLVKLEHSCITGGNEKNGTIILENSLEALKN